MSSAVIPAVTPAPAAPVTAKPASQSGSVSPSADLSFMAALLANLVATNQGFSAAPSDGVDPAEPVPIPVPVKFGGTFNMDPSLLVLSDGAQTDALAGSPEVAAPFSDELLSALTPGLPAERPASDTAEADPRLIATGLSPAEMEELMAKLSALASSAPPVSPDSADAQQAPVSPPISTSASASTSAPAPSLAIVSILPDDSAAPVTQTVTSDKNPQSQLMPAPTVNLEADSSIPVQPNPQAVPTATKDDDFDPVEFRLAMKSRFGTVNPYQQSGTTPPPSSPAPASPGAGVQAEANAAIKGAMQQPANANTVQGPAFTSAFSADAPAFGFLNVASDFDLLPGSAVLPHSSIQSGGLTNPVLQNVSAVQSHPATQAVAALIVRNAQNNNGPQTLAIQLDPPELGRLQLKMKYEKGEPLKVHVVLEKADTLAMFQRDAHALESALNQAGLKTDGSSLSFNLAQDNSAFQQAMSDQGHSGQNHNGSWTADGPGEIIETKMSVFTDPETGLTHYNLLV